MKCALLVVDMQTAVFEMKQPVFAANDLIQSVEAAVGAAHERGIRVVFTRHENKSFLVKHTPGWEIIQGIGVRESDVIIGKKHPDVFADTGLDAMFKEQGIDTVIVLGLISNGCVKAACLSALDKGYAVYLLSDAHSTFYKHAEKIIAQTNSEMEAAGVKLLSVEQMITLRIA